MKKFFDTLNYSSCNEDAYSELEALNIQPEDRVACITGSGDRPLHMLLNDPKHVYAFDANKTQNYLLELKIAGIKKMGYEEYIQFLGLHPVNKKKREKTYLSLRQELSHDAAEWFDNNIKKIQKGILYAGRWETYFNFAAKQINIWRKKKIKKLFSFRDIKKQQGFARKKWDTPLWRTYLKIFFNKFFFKWIFGDPGFYSQVNDKFSTGEYIHKCLQDHIENHLAIESFMLALIFRGKFFNARHYPPYLNAKYFPILKKRINRISIHNILLDDLFVTEAGQKSNKFSLSDVSSFLDEEGYIDLFQNIAMKPGRRFCIRDFMTGRDVLPECPDNINFFPDLQEELRKKDRSIGYTFIIGVTR